MLTKTQKKSNALISSWILFGIVFFVVAQGKSAWSENLQADRPLYREMEQAPLAYVRLPMPWQRQEFSEAQRARLGEKMLGAMLPGAGRNFALRALLNLSKGPLELSVLPPENPYLPLPSFILRIEGTSAEIVPALEQLVVAMVSDMQGSPATWVKFNESTSGKNIRQAFLLGGHVWLVPSDKGVSFYFSSNIDFLKKLNGKGLDLEESKGTRRDDLYLYLDPKNALRHYAAWLKHAKLGFPFECITSAQGWSLGQVELFTCGTGADFEMRLQGRWASGMPELLEKTKDRRDQAILIAPSAFNGALCLPRLNKAEALSWLNKIPVAIAEDQKTAMAECWSTFGERLSFSWPESSPSPLIRLDLAKPKEFEAALATLLAPPFKVASEPNSSYRHVVWPKGELSYRIQGEALMFSPFLQALKDTESVLPVRQTSKEDFVMEYPLEGRLSGNHYGLFNMLLSVFSLDGQARMAPNDVPAFSSLKMKDEIWKSKASMVFKSNDREFNFQWKQPYGIGGLSGGIQLQSSGWIYFLTLLQFTKQSF